MINALQQSADFPLPDGLILLKDSATESQWVAPADAVALLQREPELSVAVWQAIDPVCDDGGVILGGVWHDPDMALRLRPPAPCLPLVVRKAALDRVGPLRNCDAPLWDWLLRAQSAGETIHRMESNQVISDHIENLPCLAPAHPGTSRDWLLSHLTSAALPGETASRTRAAVRQAGILIWHDYLDEGHTFAQTVEGHSPGDYWHAIMHRREPDYGNARYWFRRIDHFDFQPRLAAAARRILGDSPDPACAPWMTRLMKEGAWSSLAFVDLCEACAEDETTPLAQAARRIQRLEMALLLEGS
jgi:hypothetical protein